MRYYIDTTDKRTFYLKQLLESKSNIVYTYDENQPLQEYRHGDCIIFSPAKRFDEINLSKLPSDVMLICGMIKNELLPIIRDKHITYKNILEDETYAVKNCKLTAEGVLALILERSEKSIYENNILILGGGRVAKSCALLFQKLNLQYSIASFNKEKFPQNYFFSEKNYLGYDFVKDIKNFDIIINSIPAKIITNKITKKINKGTIFIETASGQCLDKNEATHFEYILAPGLPQKYCALSAGRIMLESIIGDNYE